MERVYNAKIIIDLGNVCYPKYEREFAVRGTGEEVYAAAHDLMHATIAEYAGAAGITADWRIKDITKQAGHTIIWDEGVFMMYAVVPNDGCELVLGVYPTRADAEEAIFAECESYVYEMMMIEDVEDVVDKSKWDWHDDWLYFMKDCADCFHIQCVPVYMN